MVSSNEDITIDYNPLSEYVAKATRLHDVGAWKI